MPTKKTTTKKKKVTISEDSTKTYYTNSTGVYCMVDGKLYNKKGERVSSKDVSTPEDTLKKCDEKGKLVSGLEIVSIKNNK